MTITLLSLLIGMLIMAGLLLAATSLLAPQPALHAALAQLGGTSELSTGALPLDNTSGSLVGRLGRLVLMHTPLRPNPRQMALIRLSGMDLTDYYGYRTFYAIVMAAMPWGLQVLCNALNLNLALGVPAIATVLLGLLGWFLPAMNLSRQQRAVTDDTYEAFIVMLDLVVLERLADSAAIDAITRAAFVSRAPLFVQVQRTLNRAVLENVAPWAGLARLAEEIQLPELNDLVSIALLQEQGASLVDTLRARTAELRNQSLLRLQTEATQVTERLVFPKMLPPLAVMLLIIGGMMLNLILQNS